MRIPVQVVAPGHEPPPSNAAVLLLVGGEASPQAGVAAGWAAVRRLPVAAVGAHGAVCACCSGRSGLAEALGVLFMQRARAELPWFSLVVLSAPEEQLHEVAAILRDDVLVSGRFRGQAEN